MILETFCTGPLETNSYLAADESAGEAIVVDPGSNVDELLAALSAKNLILKAIVNTHGHYDHVGGNRRLKEATGTPIMIHTTDAPLAECASGLARLVSARADDSPPADIHLAEGDEVRAGDLTFLVLHTPGHTPGSITLLGEGSAFCGDLLFAGSVGKTDLPGCSPDLLLDSIRRRILTLPDETVLYPGHGPATTVGRERAHNPFL